MGRQTHRSSREHVVGVLVVACLVLVPAAQADSLPRSLATPVEAPARLGTIQAQATWTAGNGHTYAVVAFSDRSWDEARADVAATLPGFHLATATSAEENTFIADLVASGSFIGGGRWLGGVQVPITETNPNAGWTWVTGEPWAFENWSGSEPNDAGRLEQHLILESGRWNDCWESCGGVRGYVAESWPTERIQGTVTSTTGGAALHGICVEAHLGGVLAATAETDALGAYFLPLAPGTYKVRFDDCGLGVYRSEWYDDRRNRRSADPVAVIVDQTTAGVDAALDVRLRCDGRVPTHVGTAGDDVITGTPGADVIVGLDGDDTLSGFGGGDALCGGAGDDELRGGGGADFLSGGIGHDDLFGGTGGDSLLGSSGNDHLDGGSGNDSLVGGWGSDELFGGSGIDELAGHSGNDTLDGGASADTLLGGAGNDLLIGGSGNNTLVGNSGVDEASFADEPSGVVVDLAAGTATLTTAAPGADSLVGIENLTGTDFDDVLRGNGTNNVINGGRGDDWLVGRGGRDTLNGGGGHDTLEGGSSVDALNGNDGDDFLRGGSGNDLLDGGPGDDALAGEAGGDQLIGGSGADFGDFEFSPKRVNANLSAGTATGEGADTLSQIEHLFGSRFGDVLTGNNSANILIGWDGNDRLVGNRGNDTLDGLAGHDQLFGGVGRDLLIGGRGNDRLEGGSGNDILAGEQGDDRYIGGTGFDIATFELATSSITASLETGTASGQGSDTLRQIQGIVGSQRGDDLSGNSAFNGIDGLGGNDTIRGRAGPDNLFGSRGSDRLFGESGNDFLNGNQGSDTLNGGTGTDACTNGETHISCENIFLRTAEAPDTAEAALLSTAIYQAHTSAWVGLVSLSKAWGAS